MHSNVSDPASETALTTAQQLGQLAQRANEAHRKVPAALCYALVSAYEAGQALCQAFGLCPKGNWLAWLAANFKGSVRTARRYMNFATECDHLGLNGSTLGGDTASYVLGRNERRA